MLYLCCVAWPRASTCNSWQRGKCSVSVRPITPTGGQFVSCPHTMNVRASRARPARIHDTTSARHCCELPSSQNGIVMRSCFNTEDRSSLYHMYGFSSETKPGAHGHAGSTYRHEPSTKSDGKAA